MTFERHFLSVPHDCLHVKMWLQNKSHNIFFHINNSCTSWNTVLLVIIYSRKHIFQSTHWIFLLKTRSFSFVSQKSIPHRTTPVSYWKQGLKRTRNSLATALFQLQLYYLATRVDFCKLSYHCHCTHCEWFN